MTREDDHLTQGIKEKGCCLNLVLGLTYFTRTRVVLYVSGGRYKKMDG